MQPKYQTLYEFLRTPFGRQDLVQKMEAYDKSYRTYLGTNKIRVVAFTEIEGSYYMHVVVPSESAKTQEYKYDVVIRFFAPTKEIAMQGSLRNYYVQFFSNSPSFIYKYAVLYRNNGALIEFLYDKMNPEYANVLPEKTNASMEISFDKSIYYATKFLSEHKFRYLNKMGVLLQKKRTPKIFFANIRDFETVKLERMLISEELRLQKEQEKYKQGKTKTPTTSSRKFALEDELADHKKPGITIASKKTAKRSTSRGIISARKATKKTARKTTYRNI